MRVKMSKQPPPAPTASAVGPCSPNCRTPRHWKFTQHHHTTRPPQRGENVNLVDSVVQGVLKGLNDRIASLEPSNATLKGQNKALIHV